MRMKFFTVPLLLAIGMMVSPASAQGTIPISGSQSVNSIGQPLAGCLLYIFQAGTIATPQNAFLDTALTQPLPNPMQCDQNGRLPFFYLANGSVHARLTDSSGVVQFDYPSLLVVGPSSGGGGGQSFDPTSIPVTGDVKFRPTGDVVSGWVKLNATSIGNAGSTATQLASATAQNLYSYLWSTCSDAHCPLNGAPGNRGASASADFLAAKVLTLPDMRSRGPLGLADMGSSSCVRTDCIVSGNVTSGGGDGITTPNATGGSSNTTLAQANLPNVTLPLTTPPTYNTSLSLSLPATSTVTDPGHTHTYTVTSGASTTNPFGAGQSSAAQTQVTSGPCSPTWVGTSCSGADTVGTGITVGTTVNGSASTATTTINAAGSTLLGGAGTSYGNISPFMLGTWYMKL
jgi:hypothetical protein